MLVCFRILEILKQNHIIHLHWCRHIEMHKQVERPQNRTPDLILVWEEDEIYKRVRELTKMKINKINMTEILGRQGNVTSKIEGMNVFERNIKMIYMIPLDIIGIFMPPRKKMDVRRKEES